MDPAARGRLVAPAGVPGDHDSGISLNRLRRVAHGPWRESRVFTGCFTQNRPESPVVAQHAGRPQAGPEPSGARSSPARGARFRTRRRRRLRRCAHQRNRKVDHRLSDSSRISDTWVFPSRFVPAIPTCWGYIYPLILGLDGRDGLGLALKSSARRYRSSPGFPKRGFGTAARCLGGARRGFLCPHFRCPRRDTRTDRKPAEPSWLRRRRDAVSGVSVAGVLGRTRRVF
jgi:hypothetical protein